jgi:hypothetical protein
MKKTKELKSISEEIKKAASILGRRGGLKKNENKKITSAENGKLGGRPKKKSKKKSKKA